MSESRTLTIVLQDLLQGVDQLRSTVADLTDRLTAAEREPRTITVQDLVVASGLSVDTVKKYIREGKLPGRQIGDRYVIPDLEFDAFRRGEWQPRIEQIRPARDLVHSVPKVG